MPIPGLDRIYSNPPMSRSGRAASPSAPSRGLGFSGVWTSIWILRYEREASGQVLFESIILGCCKGKPKQNTQFGIPSFEDPRQVESKFRHVCQLIIGLLLKKKKKAPSSLHSFLHWTKGQNGGRASHLAKRKVEKVRAVTL